VTYQKNGRAENLCPDPDRHLKLDYDWVFLKKQACFKGFLLFSPVFNKEMTFVLRTDDNYSPLLP
jgi:hypothetical protein